MILYDTHNTRITLGQEVASGSNATLYEVMGEPTLLAKQYTSSPDDYEAKLTWMIAHPPVSSRSEKEPGVTAWPQARLYNSRGKFAGCLLPYLSNSVPLYRPIRKGAKEYHSVAFVILHLKHIIHS